MNYRLVVLKLHPFELENYRAAIGSATPETAFRALAQALCAGLSGQGKIPFRVRLRLAPTPVLGFFGEIDEERIRLLKAQSEALRHACRTLHYVGLERARQDCLRLAQRLVERIGSETLATCKFVAVPRGGLVVLGMLSYALGLQREQLEPGESVDTALVVVDDCCLSGVRCAEAVERYSESQLIFAHLYSHPELRSEVEKEDSVLACVAAHELHDFGPTLLGDRFAQWRRDWCSRLEGRRFWVGVPEALGFFWSEPDRSVYVSETHPMERAWKVVPPDLCIDNRWMDAQAPALSEQPRGVGPIRPSDKVLFVERGETLVVGDLESGDCLELGGSAPRIWTHLVDLGTVEAAARAVAKDCDVTLERALHDTEELWRQLAERGLLVRDG